MLISMHASVCGNFAVSYVFCVMHVTLCPFEQDLERDVEKLSQTHENLRRAECEIHTLKSFLTSKTAMVERRKKELQDVRTRLAELEEKDGRRAVILADVLEKTARQYQQQLAIKTATPGATKTVSFQPELPKSDLGGTLPSDRYRIPWCNVLKTQCPASFITPLIVPPPTQAI